MRLIPLWIGTLLVSPSLDAHGGEPTAPPSPASSRAPEPTREEEAHWAFVPPARPVIPRVSNPQWVRNPIDAFILEKLEETGLRPAPESEKVTLLRRLTFDLTGLPPTPEEVEAFLSDTSVDAYESEVRRLLSSPRYGVRWAQHWLDLVGYADSDGYEADEIRPHSWRYRDWVVFALNRDMPYDQFVRQQLAGDEIAPDDPLAFVATGFLRCPPVMHDPDPEVRRQNGLNAITDTVGLVFLGLTIGCARCHDHKFDPVPQSDFYRLEAFFAAVRLKDDHPIATAAQRTDYRREVDAWENRVQAVLAGLIRIEAAARDELAPGLPPGAGLAAEAAFRKPESERSAHEVRLVFEAMQRDRRIKAGAILAKLGPAAVALRSKLLTRLRAETRAAPAPLPLASGVYEAGVSAPPTYLLRRGELGAKGEPVMPGFPAALCTPSMASTPSIAPNGRTTGRREALANWLVRPDHPLTARVIVNRLWQHHFGRGIVASPSDFGLMGDAPTHPELLDWLATELVARGWSLKELHKLIVTSAAYRQSLSQDATAMRLDPDNSLFWRPNRRRLDAEEIRDALLAVSDQLNHTRGGPPFAPAGTKVTRGVPAKLKDETRRSLYMVIRRSRRFPFFEVFDRPDAHNSCPQRYVTTVPTQALVMLNGKLSHHSARALAAKITRESGADHRAQHEQAYRLVLGRPPDDQERQLGLHFLAESPLEDLLLSLINSNEFIYLD